MRLELPLPPSANSYWQVARGRIISTEEARMYKRKVALLARTQGLRGPPLTGDVLVGVGVYLDKRSDLDNRLKPLLDSLQGLCFENDLQVGEIHAVRYIAPSERRVVLRVEPMPPRAWVQP